MHRLVPVKDAVVSGLYESFVCNGRFQNTASGNCPISLSRVPVPVSLPLGHSQFYKVFHSRSGELPLFPNIGAEFSSQPFVPPLHCRLHTRNPEVAQPAPGVDFYVLHWALFWLVNLPLRPALYAISVRQARVLPIRGPLGL